jgi:hypothetical protein
MDVPERGDGEFDGRSLVQFVPSNSQVSPNQRWPLVPPKRMTLFDEASYAMATPTRGQGESAVVTLDHWLPSQVQVSLRKFPLYPPKRTALLIAVSQTRLSSIRGEGEDFGDIFDHVYTIFADPVAEAAGTVLMHMSTVQPMPIHLHADAKLINSPVMSECPRL